MPSKICKGGEGRTGTKSVAKGLSLSPYEGQARRPRPIGHSVQNTATSFSNSSENNKMKRARNPGPWWWCFLGKVLEPKPGLLQPPLESLGRTRLLHPWRRAREWPWCFRMHRPLGPGEKAAEAGEGTKQSAGASAHSSLEL